MSIRDVQVIVDFTIYQYQSTRFNNPFRYLLANIDLISIFQILFSLLALVFAYDAIAGDRENGTLRLTLANPVGRGLIVIAKYVGAIVCLTLSLLISFLNAQINQIQVAREFNRISPTSIAQYTTESLAGTGFQRHLNFLKNAERYADVFNDFLISADRADPDSLHVLFVREGMSDKPVPFESIPKFQDRVRLGDAFKSAILDITLLLLFFTALFAAAHASFQRKEI